MIPDPIIQVAGVRDLAEARLIVDAGANWLGFPLRLDVNTPDLTEAEASRVISALHADVRSVVITYLERATAIRAFLNEMGTRYVQVHGSITPDEIRRLREIGPDLFIIKSLVVHGQNGDELARDLGRYEPLVDAFITDTFDPATGARGATGKTHDWRISRRLVEVSKRPVILAGGLNPDNVAAAIAAVRPAGVDVHTGVEDATGAKDSRRLRAFVAAARTAFEASTAR